MNKDLLDFVARRLAEPLDEEAGLLRGDHDLNRSVAVPDPVGSPGMRNAAVLVPLVDRVDGVSVLLTRRADHLSSHAGQVSFPGGRVEEEDETHEHAALRETWEEIGIEEGYISPIGRLDPYVTGTNFCIHPIVAVVREGFDLVIDAGEVAEVFEVPFEFLMDPTNHRKKKAMWQGIERRYYEMPYGRHYIWGATAGMLVNLHRRLYGSGNT